MTFQHPTWHHGYNVQNIWTHNTEFILIYIYIYNTSLNKSRAWHIDGVTNKQIHEIFYKVLNLQIASAKIWAQLDY